MKKALLYANRPSEFFNILNKMNQLDYWFEEVKQLIGWQQNPKKHPEGDVYEHTMLSLDEATAYAELGMNKEATHILEALVKNSEQYLTWYLNLPQKDFLGSGNDCRLHIYVFQQAIMTAEKVDSALADKLKAKFEQYYVAYQQRGGAM